MNARRLRADNMRRISSDALTMLPIDVVHAGERAINERLQTSAPAANARVARRPSRRNTRYVYPRLALVCLCQNALAPRRYDASTRQRVERGYAHMLRAPHHALLTLALSAVHAALV